VAASRHGGFEGVVAVRSYDFMQSEAEVHELLRRFVAQWRGAIGPKPVDRRALIVCEALDQIADDLVRAILATADGG